MAKLTDRDAAQETVVRLFVSTDRRDWPAVRKLFDARVRFDMTSLAGGAPSVLSPDEIVAMWEQGLKCLDGNPKLESPS